MEKAEEILNSKQAYALIGATVDKSKYSYELLSILLEAGYTVYPVNPKYEKIEDMTCFPDLHSLPQKPEVVLMVLAPQNTEKLIPQVIDYNPEVIWMPPGCWSENAIKACQEAGKQVIYDVCPIATLIKMGKIN